MSPTATPSTASYWDGAAAGELRLQHCNECGKFYFYPRPFCRYCRSANVEWRTTSGRGQLTSFVINRRPLPFVTEISPIIAIVTLDEGPRLSTNIVGVDADTEIDRLVLDAPVQVEFRTIDGVAIPVFALSKGDDDD